ncbi:Spy/CpxP family protein refolding chaperone [Arcobacter lacus]|uniref:Spy/CpxP family protein refolding chaperone n=1 Tax=Arcobacter lacus TaxID=1912876 RepID=UPI0021BB50D8|nr:Spy/CpxP family protein refolding chaperone [Arcobacter lacus]MCT7910846.1 Spy/CpxP family protein refolding chaperone [Arcobacter lacus]
MKKIVSSLVITGLVAGALFAANGEMKKDDKRFDGPNCMHQKGDFKGKENRGENDIFGLIHELNLTTKQKEDIKKIMDESRNTEKNPLDAFTKDGFDKAKFIQIENEKRDSMLKSRAEVIEKTYAVLDSKQKEQLKVLIDLKKEKINKK